LSQKSEPVLINWSVDGFFVPSATLHANIFSVGCIFTLF